MKKGGLSIGRLGGKSTVKAVAGNSAKCRKRLSRTVSKARRSALRTVTASERSWTQEIPG